MRNYLSCILLVATATISQAEEKPQIPAPVKNTSKNCPRFGNLPPVCPYEVYLTEQQAKTLEKLHKQNVDKIQSAK